MRIRYIRLDNWNEEDASIVLRLMVLSNDIMMCDQLRGLVTKNATKSTAEFDEGTHSYLMRLLSAQIFEALEILPDIQRSNSMQIIINRNASVQRAFDRLLEYKKGGKKKKAHKTLKGIRNQAMFHYVYAGEYLVNNLKKRVKDGIETGKIVFGDDTPMRFVVADEINQMVFTFDILGHHDGKDFDEALKESTNILNNAVHDFSVVASALVLGGIKDRFC